MKKSAEKGFTLAELLIALGILGVIAAFTIPKILSATGQAQNTAALRDTVSILEQTWYSAKLQQQTVAGTLFANLTAPTATGALNFQDAAAGAPNAAGAPYNAAATLGTCGLAANTGWIRFANGIVITSISDTAGSVPANISNGMAATNNEVLCVDTNGGAGPNTLGTDQFLGTFNASGFGAAGAAPNTATAATNKNFFWGDQANNYQTHVDGAAPAAVSQNAGAGAGRLLQ